LIAFPSDTLAPRVFRFVVPPLLKRVAISALGFDDAPAA
jgi:hypothetical protein